MYCTSYSVLNKQDPPLSSIVNTTIVIPFLACVQSGAYKEAPGTVQNANFIVIINIIQVRVLQKVYNDESYTRALMINEMNINNICLKYIFSLPEHPSQSSKHCLHIGTVLTPYSDN